MCPCFVELRHNRLSPLRCPYRGPNKCQHQQHRAYRVSTKGEEFWRTEPQKYPNRYYGFQTKLRINIFIGERLTIRLKDSSKNDGRAITLFYELSSFDFFIVSAITNKEIKTKDLLSLSFGLKLQLL